MEIKVGEYVRTKDGLIAKLININDYECVFDSRIQWFYEYYREDIDFDDWKDFVEEKIVKHSPNIIDLIEVGDYVNGYKVLDIVKGFKVIIDKLELDTTTGTYRKKGLKNIETIVTKEQFKEMEYKV